jgi:geranylgeranylglycerol-phosphate geranylgeranyltransferase
VIEAAQLDSADIEDISGDREEGLNTLPVVIGKRRSLFIATIALVAAVGVSPVLYFTGLFGITYLILLIPADLVMIYANYRSFTNPEKGQSVLKYGMFLATGAFIMSRVVGLF